ncbi:glutathione S-transferase Mu 3-like [Meles meles]|uniref:glutathione S-transferase Mu 3-like n=1 Tax=Meles meles TaxID=9662 RepID=UPI001E69C31D|nr:glutathione S-transferase Mu 3-like [Meles meles]
MQQKVGLAGTVDSEARGASTPACRGHPELLSVVPSEELVGDSEFTRPPEFHPPSGGKQDHHAVRADSLAAGSLPDDTEEEKIRVDIVENQVMDFRMQLIRLCYSPDLEKMKPQYLEQLPGQLKQFSLFLGKFSWFAGEKLTFVDFLTYDVLDQNRMFEPKCLDEFPNLKAFMCRFETLEKIANYMQSDRFLKMPINNKMAQWGNKRIC